MVKELIFRKIADFLSVERYHLEFMGLFELFCRERNRIQVRNGDIRASFRVDFPPLYKPEDLFMDKEWYIIPEDFFRLYRDWILPVAESARRLFDEKIVFP